MHEDTSEVKLHLETNIDIGSVDGGRPPESESSVRNLVKPRSLCVSEFLVLHGFLEAGSFLPEETLPSREIRALEESVFEYPFDTTECLNHVSAVVVEVP